MLDVRDNASPQRSSKASGKHAEQRQRAVIGDLAHALAEAQILPEFLNGLRSVDVHAKDGKHLFDGMLGCILGHSLGIGAPHACFGYIA